MKFLFPLSYVWLFDEDQWRNLKIYRLTWNITIWYGITNAERTCHDLQFLCEIMSDEVLACFLQQRCKSSKEKKFQLCKKMHWKTAHVVACLPRSFMLWNLLFVYVSLIFFFLCWVFPLIYLHRVLFDTIVFSLRAVNSCGIFRHQLQYTIIFSCN